MCETVVCVERFVHGVYASHHGGGQSLYMCEVCMSIKCIHGRGVYSRGGGFMYETERGEYLPLGGRMFSG